MPTEETFDFIFDAVQRKIKNDFPRKVDGDAFCGELVRRKLAMRSSYIAIRNDIKNTYMIDPTSPLDRHKCAAAFMIAFMENFISLKEKSIAMESVAISVGLHILKIFIKEHCKNHNDESLINAVDRNGGFSFPVCVCDEEPYRDNWALGLYYDRKKSKLSALSLSNVLFLIEKHNRGLLSA